MNINGRRFESRGSTKQGASLGNHINLKAPMSDSTFCTPPIDVSKHVLGREFNIPTVSGELERPGGRTKTGAQSTMCERGPHEPSNVGPITRRPL